MDGYISAALQVRPRTAIVCAVFLLLGLTALPVGASTTAPLSANLRVTVSGPGRVTSSPPGIDCPSRCTATLDAPSPVRLTAHVTEGTVFTGWGGPCHADGDVCDLVVAGDTSIEARFALAGPPAPPPPPAPAPAPVAGRCTQYEALLAANAPAAGWDAQKMSKLMWRTSRCNPAKRSGRATGLLGISSSHATALTTQLGTKVDRTTLTDPTTNVRAAATLCQWSVAIGRSCYRPWGG